LDRSSVDVDDAQANEAIDVLVYRKKKESLGAHGVATPTSFKNLLTCPASS